MRLKSTWRRKRGFIWISASKTGHVNFEWLWPSITFVGKVLPVGFLVALAVAGQMSGFGFIEIPTGFPGPHCNLRHGQIVWNSGRTSKSESPLTPNPGILSRAGWERAAVVFQIATCFGCFSEEW